MLPDDLRELLELLNARNVEYVVVGGYAVAYHGYPRYTGDIDVFVRRSPENATRILGALGDFGFGDVGLTAEDFTEPDSVVQLGRPPLRVDLLTSISAVTFDQAWGNHIRADLGGVRAPIIGLAELLQNKRASGRAKDEADVAELERDDE